MCSGKSSGLPRRVASDWADAIASRDRVVNLSIRMTTLNLSRTPPTYRGPRTRCQHKGFGVPGTVASSRRE